MRVWLELNQQEGEQLFEVVKSFTVERMKTAVMGALDEAPAEESVEEKKEEPVKTKKAKTETSKAEVTLETVRAVLAEKKKSGKEIKDLFTKFGATKLSEVAPENYEDLIREAEVL